MQGWRPRGSRRRRAAALPILYLFLALAETATAQVGDVPRPAEFPRCLVVSAHAEASRAGVEVLQAGGNAVDAAVAVGFALAVTHPAAGNLGGGGFLVLRLADGGATTIDFRETAPAAASRDMYLDDDGDVVPGLSLEGHLAAGVPGSPAGLLLALERYGRLDRARVLAPAIRLARDGFPLTRGQAADLNEHREAFSRYEGSRVFIAPDGRTGAGAATASAGAAGSWREGDLLVQPDLARTLERIRDRGRDGFYAGETADLIAAEMRRGGGLITPADLAAYEAVERPALAGRYRGHRVLTMGPPSAGGVALLQLLRAVEPFPVAEMGRGASATIHLMAEAMRRAYADRARWLGDPAFVAVPVAALIDSAYVRGRMSDFDPQRVSGSDAVGPGRPPAREGNETTHYSVVDEEGNAVAVTTTINSWFGSHVTVAGAGFLLNNEMDDFSAAPGIPDQFGLVGGEANAVAPGKRMLSSMTPTIVEDPAGRLRLVAGSPGGSTIITTVFQVILNVVDHGLNVQQAVLAPRVHHQWRPDDLRYERRGLPVDVVRALERRGWTVREREGTSGRAHCILVDHGVGRRLQAGVDPRGEGAAAGY